MHAAEIDFEIFKYPSLPIVNHNTDSSRLSSVWVYTIIVQALSQPRGGGRGSCYNYNFSNRKIPNLQAVILTAFSSS
ncbi:hypothetical protein WN55_10412 [Dufourea novaeangliae]|uniref:Uncharacterized protein n=1 Tax=Dufourea novaeangliae TaxID=178035 RepID=A0A154P3Q0_DUFNO|nr:hypothetical protein WN55_10412 [Dufourea novaeangliae]